MCLEKASASFLLSFLEPANVKAKLQPQERVVGSESSICEKVAPPTKGEENTTPPTPRPALIDSAGRFFEMFPDHQKLKASDVWMQPAYHTLNLSKKRLLHPTSLIDISGQTINGDQTIRDNVMDGFSLHT